MLKAVPREEKSASLKRTEQVLKEREQRFAIAMEGSLDGLWDWDTITDSAFYCDKYNQMLGFEPGELHSSC